MPDVALLTEARYEAPRDDSAYVQNILLEDRLVAAALARRGMKAHRIDWARDGVDWSKFAAAVLRTTWDYFERHAEFVARLRAIAAATRLVNPLDLVLWNTDKHYLRDLAARGVPIVPTRFLERGERADLGAVLRDEGWDDAVVKPAISGAARHTYRFDRQNASALQPLADDLLRDEALLVQPFQRRIVEDGELTVVVIGGRAMHAVRKVAKPGDFRVQDDHGGTAHAHAATAQEIAFAERAIAACKPAPLYGRVDMVQDDGGRWQVMELELVEPELWYRLHPPAAEVFAAALVS